MAERRTSSAESVAFSAPSSASPTSPASSSDASCPWRAATSASGCGRFFFTASKISTVACGLLDHSIRRLGKLIIRSAILLQMLSGEMCCVICSAFCMAKVRSELNSMSSAGQE
eukprot:scaffold7340_cov266-Pinguiococcus_pyrenoidosus.AAC.84